MATPHLNPSSDLIKLLSSLGLDTEQDNGGAQQQHEPLGPDPLVVARGRLTKLKADIDALAPPLKSLVDEGSSSSGQVALRIQPPITSSSHLDSPPLLRLPPGQTWQEASAAAAKASRQPCSYLPFDTAAQAADYLRTLLTQLTQHFESLRSTLVAEAQERIRQTLAAASKDPAALADATAGRERQVVDEDGRILNEEGLPFVDPTERIAESAAAASSTDGADRGSTVAPFKPQQTLEGDERKKWIDNVFSRFEGIADEDDDDEDEEDAEDGNEGDVARKAPRTDPVSTPPPPAPPQAKPLKSALKASPAPPLTTDSKFGHQGIRRGFLNMNPSSPAAVSSSDPIEARSEEVTPAASSLPMSRSQSQGESRSHDREEEANVEAMTQSMTGLENFGAPAASPAKSKKKSVRIQSPERSRKPAVTSPPVDSTSASISTDPDAGVEDEAARIVNLLGPEVVAGTERGEEALKSLRDEQAQAEEAARRQVEEIKRKKREQEENKAKGPAVGLSVMERPRGAKASGSSGATAAAVSAAKQSAFKRGFLNRPPPRAATTSTAPPTPASSASSSAGPRESLGMSALDRSLISDVPLEAERESQGLPPAVPHARPSKAYREKLEKRREQGDVAEMEVDDGIAGESIVVGTGKEAAAGGNSSSSKGVRFQLDSAAVTHQEADDDHDDEDMEEEDDDEVAELREGDTAELELDEHDEEAYARSAYASGDVADDESGHAGTLGDGDDDDDEEDAAHDSDWSLDSYEHYSASDLADLEPTFTGLVSDLENAELAREYALAKARQMQERQTMSEERRKELAMAISGERMKEEERLARGGGGGDKEDELWREDEIDGRDLVSAMGFEEEEIKKRREVDPPNRMSRFKASRIVQALGMGVDGVSGEASSRPAAGYRERGTEEDRKADEAGHELAHLLEGATNAGPGGAVPGAEASSSRIATAGPSPVMVLPSMTPLRYPKAPSTSAARVSNLKESDRLPKGGVDLEGETDEDEKDDVLMDVMRARLEEKEYREKKRMEKEAAAAAAGSDEAAAAAAAARRRQQAPPPPRSRWNGIDEDDRDTRSGVAMAAPPSIGGGAAKAKKRELPVSSSSSSGTDVEQPSAPVAAAASPPPAQEAPPQPQQKMSRFKAARLAAAAAANQQP